jgi:hypothetical protein
MASALKSPALEVTAVPHPCVEQQRTTLTANLEEDIAHAGPSGVAPWGVECFTVVPATTGAALNFEWHKADSNTTNNTIRVKWGADAGADLTGMEVILRVHFPAMKSGGITIT